MISASTFSYELSRGEGTLQPPTFQSLYERVENITWKFVNTLQPIILIDFTDFDKAPCKVARLHILEIQKTSIFCGEKVPPMVYSIENITVVYEVGEGASFGKGFVLHYVFPKIALSKDTFAVSKSEVVDIAIAGIFPQINCQCTFESDGEIHDLRLGSQNTEVVQNFSISGVRKYHVYCFLETIKQDYVGTLEKLGNFTIHDDINSSSVLINIRWNTSISVTYLVEATVSVQHAFIYAITYSLVFGTDTKHLLTKHPNYTDEKMYQRSDMNMTFKITEEVQQLLGPGLHEAKLVIQNDISIAEIPTEMILNLELTGLVIEVDEYVDIYPATFPITIYIRKGAPAFLEVLLKSEETRKVLSKNAMICETIHECNKGVTVDLNVKSPSKFKIYVTANNSLGPLTAMSETIESFHRVHEVFATFESPAYVGKKVKIFIFYKIYVDIAVFNLLLTRNDDVLLEEEISNHKQFQTLDTTAENMKLPIIPKDFKIFVTEQLFETEANIELIARISTTNKKVQLEDKFLLNVLKDQSQVCLSAVKIRDGNKENYNNRTIRVLKSLVLTASVKLHCQLNKEDEVEYTWTIHKDANKVSIEEIDFTHNELAIKQDQLLPGIYIIKLTAVLRKKDGKTSANNYDYSAIEIPMLTLNAKICGAFKLEIGQDIKEFEYDASCTLIPNNIKIEYKWCCTISDVDIPVDKNVGTYTNKGSCFKGRPACFSTSKSGQLEISNTVIKDKLFLRLFVIANNYYDGVADQEIIILPQPVPIVNIVCWSNCATNLNPQDSLILQIECEKCIKFQWEIIDWEDYVVQECNSSDFCQINQDILTNIGEVVEVKVEGIDEFGRSATSLFYGSVKKFPSNMTCEHDPNSGFAFVTQFRVSCSAEDNNDFIYQFFLLNEDDTNPLLQHGYENTLENLILPPGLTNIGIQVCSSTNACIKVNIFIEVKPAPDEIAEKIIRDIPTQISNAINSGNLQQATKSAALLLKHVGLDSETKLKLTNKLASTRFSSTKSAKQISDILRESTKTTGMLPTDVVENLVEKLTEIQEWILYDEESSSDTLKSVALSSMHLSSNIMESMPDLNETTKTRRSDSSLLERTASVIDHLGSEILKTATPGDNPINVTTSAFRANLRKMERNSSVSIGEKEIKARIDCDWSSIRQTETINLQVIRYLSKKTRFNTQTADVDEVASISLSTTHKTHNLPKPITNSLIPSEPIQFYLHTDTEIPDSSTELEFKIEGFKDDVQNFTLNIETYENMLINIWLLSKDFPQNATVNLTVQTESGNVESFLILDKSDFSSDIYSWKFQLDGRGKINYEFTIVASVTEDVTQSRINLISNRDSAATAGTIAATSNSNLNLTNTISESTAEAETISATNIQDTALTHEIRFNLTMNIYAMKCMRWDDMINDWSTTFCKAKSGNESDNLDWCECDLSQTQSGRMSGKPTSVNIFSSKLLVFSPHLPNKIELNVVEYTNNTREVDVEETIENIKDELEQNPVVLIVISVVMFFFCGMILWARYKDKITENMTEYVEVCDNVPYVSYRYLLTVFTGNHKHAAPTATIAVKINGTNQQSILHLLQKHNDEVHSLSRGSVVTFLMTSLRCVGDITSVDVWQDGEGNNPKWYIERLVVRDYETNECWFFLANDWLNDEEPFAEPMELVLYPATMKELHSFRNIFIIKVSSFLKDSHIWYSVFALRPWYCYNMNRIERVGCCFLLTMMTIVTSLMFHGRIGDDYNILYLLSASNIIAGLESGLLCFPITYIVSVMFQSARSRNSINKSDKGNMSLEQISQNYLSSKMELFNEKKRRKSSNLRYTQKNYRSRRSSKTLNRKFSHSSNSSQNSRADAKKKLSSEKVDSLKKSSESLRSEKDVIFPDTTHRQRSKYKQSSNYRTRKLKAQKFRERRKSRNSPPTKLPIPSSRFGNSSFTKKEIAIMDVDPGSSDFKPLPWFFRYIGWMIIEIVSTGCCVLSIIYGISYGYNDTMKWLISLLFAILESIFILEPIKCVILAYIAVISNSRLDVSEWIPPLKGEVALQRHENPRKILKELIRERRTSPIYKGPVSKKDKMYSMESETTDQSL
uniref:uncharacterized protein LOC120341328 n=1 Tax=Styela clava TaxID=7725 RepID=UPI00193A4C13|nr:uncharacterized protein LOC120341328 [Styela clava]